MSYCYWNSSVQWASRLPRGELREHATQVQGHGDMLAQALDAARQVSMPSDGYGAPCQPSTVLLRLIE